MNLPARPEEAVIRLAELSAEIDELESGRSSLIKRIEDARTGLQEAGGRAAEIRASIAMVKEHLAENAYAAAELRAIRQEVLELEQSITEVSADSLGLLFEADGLQDSIGEAEEEMNTLLTILIEGSGKKPRGH
ncbi:MAG: hypothetical protein DMF61_04395 [Blastocatellia bacterium AA13]|nr:MAG: hypothetical protein DMF61_04395 [Blastocatellia bacterium AA13]